MTAFHLSDWAYASDNDAKRACRKQLLMKIRASFANNGKHFYRGRESVVAESRQHSGAFDREVFDPEAFDTDCLMVRLESAAAKEYGHESASVLTLVIEVKTSLESARPPTSCTLRRESKAMIRTVEAIIDGTRSRTLAGARPFSHGPPSTGHDSRGNSCNPPARECAAQ